MSWVTRCPACATCNPTATRATTGKLSFAPGVVSQIARVTVYDDDLDEDQDAQAERRHQPETHDD